MIRTSLFLSDHSQAVRLPKAVAFPEGVREVIILREGQRRILISSDNLWNDFFASPGIDLGERDQPVQAVISSPGRPIEV
jgi:antitoxin VapB